MRLSGYMNAPTDLDFLALRHGMENLMHHPHEPIVYSRNKYSKQMKYHINVSSKQVMQKSTKFSYTPTSSTHIVMHITQDIFRTSALLHQQITSIMVTSLTLSLGKNLRHLEAVTMNKQ